MENKVKIMLGLGAATLLLLGAFLLQSRAKQRGEQNSLHDVGQVLSDRTFKSKTEAYNALANEKEQFYNRPANAFEGDEPAPEPAAVSEDRPESEPVATVAQPLRHASQKKAEAEFDKAYNEVQQSVRQMYGEEASKEATVVQPAMASTQERRRAAMQRDWGSGKVTSSGVGSYKAVIHGSQTVRSGETALFRTKEVIRQDEILIPANTLITGTVTVSQSRLTVKIGSVCINREVYPIGIEVYGTDGLPGLPIHVNEESRITDDQSSSTAIRETAGAVSRYGGTVGRLAGAVFSGAGSQIRSEKSREVRLIDNQTVILKIVQP